MANITFISKHELKKYQFLLDISTKYFNLFIKNIANLIFLKPKFYYLIYYILKISHFGIILIDIVFNKPVPWLFIKNKFSIFIDYIFKLTI